MYYIFAIIILPNRLSDGHSKLKFDKYSFGLNMFYSKNLHVQLQHKNEYNHAKGFRRKQSDSLLL